MCVHTATSLCIFVFWKLFLPVQEELLSALMSIDELNVLIRIIGLGSQFGTIQKVVSVRAMKSHREVEL